MNEVPQLCKEAPGTRATRQARSVEAADRPRQCRQRAGQSAWIGGLERYDRGSASTAPMLAAARGGAQSTSSLSTMVSPQEAGTIYFSELGSGQVLVVASASGRCDVACTAAELYTGIAELLSVCDLEIVHERMFASLRVAPVVHAARRAALKMAGLSPATPTTYVEGRPPWGEGLAGIIIQAVAANGSGGRPWTITDGGRPCGRGWWRNGATYLLLQNLQGIGNGQGTVSATAQTARLLQRAERILQAEGASYRNVARTWFYLSRILDWYPDFNKVRNSIYCELGLMPSAGGEQLLLPASTGISGDTLQGAAATMDLLAVVPAPGCPSGAVRQLSNAAQQDAFRYGSAFSRAAVMPEPGLTQIQMSGTAAIDEAGRSLYSEDAASQIDCTFDKVAALLSQEGARLEDIRAACVFFKRPEDAAVYRRLAAARGLRHFPAVCMVADVCRDELLFEIDAEVAVAS